MLIAYLKYLITCYLLFQCAIATTHEVFRELFFSQIFTDYWKLPLWISPLHHNHISCIINNIIFLRCWQRNSSTEAFENTVTCLPFLSRCSSQNTKNTLLEISLSSSNICRVVCLILLSVDVSYVVEKWMVLSQRINVFNTIYICFWSSLYPINWFRSTVLLVLINSRIFVKLASKKLLWWCKSVQHKLNVIALIKLTCWMSVVRCLPKQFVTTDIWKSK